MENIEYYVKLLKPDTWENDTKQLEKIIQVLATYATFHGAYHIGINEINRYLYIMDHPSSITNAYNPDLEKSYIYAVNFLSRFDRDTSVDYVQRRSAIEYIILLALKELAGDTCDTILK